MGYDWVVVIQGRAARQSITADARPGVEREMGTQHLVQSGSLDVFIFLIYCRLQLPMLQNAKKQ